MQSKLSRATDDQVERVKVCTAANKMKLNSALNVGKWK